MRRRSRQLPPFFFISRKARQSVSPRLLSHRESSLRVLPLVGACVVAAPARVEALRRLVRQHVPSAEPAPAAGMEAALRLPLAAARALPDLLEELDTRMCARMPVRGCPLCWRVNAFLLLIASARSTTLEHVFRLPVNARCAGPSWALRTTRWE